MAGLARFFVSDRYQKPLIALIWLLIFTLCMLIVMANSISNVRETLRDETEESLGEFIRLRTNVLSTFDRMDEWLTAIPCSADYMTQLRRVAYLPDGINEFAHVSDGRVICSINAGQLERPFMLGPPEIAHDNPYAVAFWLDRDLSFLNLDGLTGTLARRGLHMMVIPPETAPKSFPLWMDQEVVLTWGDDWWHRTGTPGLYVSARQAMPGPLPHGGGYYHTACDPSGLHCVTSRIPAAGIFGVGMVGAGLIILGTALFSAMATSIIHAQIRRYWAFDARFSRNLEQGVMCAYQPLISMRTGEIVGCEVLARWRDLDGTIAYPDAFLPVVERENLTLPLTIAVVRTALAELEGRIERGQFHVNFNIFPRDFTIATLAEVFPPGKPPPGNLRIVAEIIETESLPLDTVQTTILHLRERGILTYIDDFGVGYSNMHNLAVLDVEGVKIDRSFAMAPDNSIMARILSHAIEMAHESGRAIVIEGVETRERLDMLRANPLVDFAQGYYISRPLAIDAFIAFIAAWTPFGETAAAPGAGPAPVRRRTKPSG